MNKITITAGGISIEATLNDSPIAEKIWQALPIAGEVNWWGEEIYFSIPVSAEANNPQEVVEIGDLAFWPPGNALCLFFGQTPVSTEDEIRPASPVEVIGKIASNNNFFKSVLSGEKIRIEQN